jgi:hypothetical protein
MARLPVAVALAASVVGACAGTATAPSSAVVSPSPSASADVASSPRPSRSPSPAETAIAAFVERVTADDVSYRVEIDGTVAAAVERGKVSGRMDTQGHDWSMALTYDFREEYPGTEVAKVQAREVDGNGYQRDPGEDWRRLRGYTSAEQTALPFATVASVADVRFIETEEGSEPRHHVRISGPVVIPPRTIPGLLTQERVRRATLDLVIDADGVPISGTWDLDATGRVGDSGQLQQIVLDADLAFSRFGTDFTIERP